MLYQEINSKIAEAMKSHSNELNVLRLIKAEFVKYEKEGNTLDEASELKILNKMVKNYKDAIDQFKSANNEEMANQYEYELSVVQNYMPKMASDDEIKSYAYDYIIAQYNAVVSMKDMKDIMATVKEKYPMADGKMLAQYVRTFIK